MDIPSLFMIPSAVSSGKVHSVFPNSTDADFDFNRDSDATRVNSEGLIERVGYYGSELVVNGGFSNGTNNWSFTDANGQVGSYFSRNEVCEIDFTNTSTIYASQSNILTNAKSYKITLDYYIPSTNASANYIQVRLGNTSSSSALSPNLDVLDNWTSVTLYGVSNGTDLYIYTPSGAIGDKFYIDNVSVKEITGDRARLNYEIEGGLVNTKPSLLLEPQSTNLITYSKDFTNSYWTKSGTSITANVTTSPDGTLNASKLVEDTSSGTHKISTSIISVSTADIHTYSIYVKSAGRTKIGIREEQHAGKYVTFNLLTKAVISNTGLTANIIDFGNNWMRIDFSQNSGGALEKFSLFLLDDGYTSGNPSSYSYTGNGTSGVHIFGAQLEQSSYPTSFIPTNGSVQSRANETCIGAGTSSILPSEEGILYAEIAYLAPTASYSNQSSLSINDGTSNNRVMIYRTTSNNNLISQVRVAGAIQATIPYVRSVEQSTEYNKIACKFKANDFAVYANGSLINTDTSGSVFSAGTLTTISFNVGINSNVFYGKVRDIRVYNTKEMTDSEVDILLTKITS